MLSIAVSFLSVMAGIFWLVARPLMSIRRLLATGAPGQATVLRFWRTGLQINALSGANRHQLAFELEVHPDGGADYAANALGILSEEQEAALKFGAKVAVRYDRAHPSRVVVAGPLAAA